MILDGKLVSEILSKELASFFATYHGNLNAYLGIVCLGDHVPSLRYVDMKRSFGQKIGMPTRILGQDESVQSDHDVLALVEGLAKDPLCLGILVQLPLPEQYAHLYDRIIELIPDSKDVDGLNGHSWGHSFLHGRVCYPATVRGVAELLHYYALDDLKGKICVILGQSALVGAPLALWCIQQGAEVMSFNIDADQHMIQQFCLKADVILCATSHPCLVTSSRVRHDQSQILIDIGWNMVDGKPTGNVLYDEVASHVAAITPVPGGVGPMTVASVFLNLRDLCQTSSKIS